MTLNAVMALILRYFTEFIELLGSTTLRIFFLLIVCFILVLFIYLVILYLAVV